MAEQKEVKLTGTQLAQLAEQERHKLAEINRRANSLQVFRNELQSARDALEEIGKNEKGMQILVNLGAGVLVKASLEENSRAISSIAANAFLEKNSKELAKDLANKISDIDNSLQNVAQEQQRTLSRLTQLNQIMEAGMRHLHNEQNKPR